jgi:hypothetical protein
MKSWAIYGVIVGCLAVAAAACFVGTRLSRLSGLEWQVSQVRNELKTVIAKLKTDNDGLEGDRETGEDLRFSTIADATNLVKSLGEQPTSEKLAEVIARIDMWLMKPEDETAIMTFKGAQQARLRGLIGAEVEAHQTAALKATSGSEALREHSAAGQILVRYPISEDASIIAEVKRLASQQAEVLNRIEVIRRQRYNRWAIGQIEQALDYYNKNVSRFNPFNDNAVLIDSLVTNLGEVDPANLEPAVLELYNYVIDRTKGSLSEQNKLELAKRLTDPSIRRKAMGDF